jgi:hypothetical protein
VHTTRLHPRINGTWLTDIGAFGDVGFSEDWRRGCDSASWNMNAWTRDSRLRAGARVDIYEGPTPVWTGLLAQPAMTGAYTAYGLAQRGNGPQAIDGSNNPTAIPTTAVSAAIARGAVPWVLTPVGIHPTDVGDPTPGLTLNGLLDRYSDTFAWQWRVNHLGEIVTESAPTTPLWAVQMARDLWTPSDQNYVTHLNVTYFSAPATYPTIQVTHAESADAESVWGHVEKSIDISDQGILSAPEATTVGQSILARTGPRLQLTGNIDLAPGQLRTLGDTTVESWAGVHAGQMIRMWGVPDPTKASPTLHTDMVIGRIARGPSTLTLTPYQAPVETFEDVIAAIYGQAA